MRTQPHKTEKIEHSGLEDYFKAAVYMREMVRMPSTWKQRSNVCCVASQMSRRDTFTALP